MSKVVTGSLQKFLEPFYEQQVGEDQFGGVRGKGTALAQLVVRSFISFCKLFSLDLSKAFDFALRDVEMGWCSALSTHQADRRQFLLDRGLPEEYIGDLIAWVNEHSSLLSQLSVQAILSLQ